MLRRNATYFAVSAVILSSIGPAKSAHAQGTQFTIRKPPDGATVREKVPIEISRSSIPTGGFVAIYLDGKFYEAVPPQVSGSGASFRWVWDTKETQVSDGEHTIKAVLYAPAPDSTEGVVDEKGSSEVKLVVANKIHNGPTSLRLSYKYPDGQQLDYSRSSSSKVVGGVSDTGVSADQTIASINSNLILDILSQPDPQALVRNKLTKLSILTNGQETTLPTADLSESMYQMLDMQGDVHYEYGSASGLNEFLSEGLPVDNTLELPRLPSVTMSVGQTWETFGQRLDIPGVPPALQPKVTLKSQLVDLEWEDGYPTAKIHQTFDSSINGGNIPKTLQFGPVPVTSPNVKYERDIYIAYTAGRLVRTTRTITVSGRTTVQLSNTTPAMGGGGFPGGMGGPGFPGGRSMGGPPGGLGFPPGMGGGNNMPRGGFPGGRSMGGPPGGLGFPPGMGGNNMPRGGFPGGRSMGGPPGQVGGGRFPGMPGGGGQGFPGGRSMGGGTMPGGRFPGASGGGAVSQEADHPVTLKAITDTRLDKVVGP